MATPEEIQRFQANLAARAGGITTFAQDEAALRGSLQGQIFQPPVELETFAADVGTPDFAQLRPTRGGLRDVPEVEQSAKEKLLTTLRGDVGEPAAEPAPDSEEVKAHYNLSDAVDQNALETQGAKVQAEGAANDAMGRFQAIYSEAMRTGQTNPAAARQYAEAKGEVGRLRGNLDKLLEEQLGLREAQTDAEVSKAEARAAGAQEISDQITLNKEEVIAENQEMAQATDAKFAAIDADIAALAEMKVDPKRAFSHMGEAEKVMFGIAMMLTGTFATAKSTDSMLNHIQGIIDRDVALQEKEFGRKREVIGEKRQQVRDLLTGLESKQARNDKARAISLEASAAMAEAQAAKYDAPEAKAKGGQLATALRQRAAEYNMAAKADEMNTALKSMHTKQANLGAALGAATGMQKAQAAGLAPGELPLGSPGQKEQTRQFEQIEERMIPIMQSEELYDAIQKGLASAGTDPNWFQRLVGVHGVAGAIFTGDARTGLIRLEQAAANKLIQAITGAGVTKEDRKNILNELRTEYSSPEEAIVGYQRFQDDLARQRTGAETTFSDTFPIWMNRYERIHRGRVSGRPKRMEK